MAWRGSLSRTFISTARPPSFRPTNTLPRLRPPPLSAPRLHSRRFFNPRTLGELGCAQSLMPTFAGARLTSHIAVNMRAFCELSHGWNGEDGYLMTNFDSSRLAKTVLSQI